MGGGGREDDLGCQGEEGGGDVGHGQLEDEEVHPGDLRMRVRR